MTSADSNSVTPSAPPSAPTNAVASLNNPTVSGQVHLTWTAPTNDGGTPLDHYTVTSNPGSIRHDVAASATATDFTGLTNGVSYTFTVTATNASQTSPASLPSNAVMPVGPPARRKPRGRGGRREAWPSAGCLRPLTAARRPSTGTTSR